MAALPEFSERLNMNEWRNLGNENCPANVRVWVRISILGVRITPAADW